MIRHPRTTRQICVLLTAFHLRENATILSQFHWLAWPSARTGLSSLVLAQSAKPFYGRRPSFHAEHLVMTNKVRTGSGMQISRRARKDGVANVLRHRYITTYVSFRTTIGQPAEPPFHVSEIVRRQAHTYWDAFIVESMSNWNSNSMPLRQRSVMSDSRAAPRSKMRQFFDWWCSRFNSPGSFLGCTGVVVWWCGETPAL